MPEPKEIPQITTELIDMSREYLRQETVEPAKRLGKHAGMGVGGAIAFSLGAFFLAWALYYGLVLLFTGSLDRPTATSDQWWVVLARFLTFVATAGTAGIVVWRMQSGDN